MSRNRVRRSFTVETKARGRQAPAFLPVRAALLESVPDGPANRLFEVAPAPSARPEPRRILPSLIPAPAVEPEPEPIRMAEPRLPRVRRPRRPAAPAAGEPPVHPTAPISVEPRMPTVAPLPVTDEPVAPAPRRIRRESDDLGPGQRWKRRLPRVCW